MALPPHIEKAILSNRTSIGKNPALPNGDGQDFVMDIVGKFYDEVSSHFDGCIVGELKGELGHLIAECKKLEKNSLEALSDLCMRLVNDIFRLPNDVVTFDINIVNKIDIRQERMVPESDTDFSFEDFSDINNISKEIYKRRFLNAMIMGCAMYYGYQVDAYKEQLDKIDNKLAPLYKKVFHLNDIISFYVDYNKHNISAEGGKVDVFLNGIEHPVRINAEGVVFPVVLIETIKGLLELAISHGLPKDKKKANFIISKTDYKLAEVWDQRIGVPLWEKLAEVFDEIDENPIEIGLNFIFMEFAQLPPDKFNYIMKRILSGDGKEIIEELCYKVHYEKAKDDFDDYMSQDNDNDGYMLTDSEFTSEELLSDDLCATNVMDED